MKDMKSFFVTEDDVKNFDLFTNELKIINYVGMKYFPNHEMAWDDSIDFYILTDGCHLLGCEYRGSGRENGWIFSLITNK